ncbi:MAG: amino acid adenylation domain-containing protein, partial [Silvibacterium sp.]
LYRESTIRRWLGHYRTLLEAIAADVTANVAELPLLNESLQNALLVQGNNTAQAYPGESSIPDLIRTQAQDSPDAVAVDFYGKKLTRRQLEEHSDRIATAIRARNIGRGNLVGICVERSVEMVVALLGVLKSGAGYVPLAPLYPRERIHSILQATKMSLLLTLDSHLSELPATAIPALSIDRAMKTPVSSIAPQDRPTADSTAYVIFTSGSTGTPKGVEITHRSVVNLLHAATKEIGFRPNDRLLAVTTLTFDIAALELLLPLVCGGTVVVARHQDSSDGARLLELIKTSRSNVLQATPITWRMLLEAGFSSWPGFKMLCGGEAWNRELANRLLSGGGRLWNMYGPTETTIWSSISEVSTVDEPILIGPPLANTQFYVLDERMQPVPPGVTGELYIGGDGLGRGYYNDPELTSAKFLRNPFLETAGARIYKTGDLVRQSEDGDIEFLRRSDHQIKLRGFRIEPGEIEKAIETCAGLKQAVVVLRQNQIGDPALIAYLVPQQKTAFDTEALRRALFARLPEYMVPSWFVVLKEFPLTSNGKVDRKALPSPAWRDAALHLHPPGEVRTSASSLIHSSLRPRTDLECAMLKIWREIFRNDAIGIQDNFFDLGGNSLTLARIQTQLKKVTDHQMLAADVFAAPTIEALAHRLESSQDRLFQSRVIPLRAEGTQPPLFLISQSMVFRRMVQWLSPDQPVFTVVMQDEDLKNGVHTTFQEIAAYYVSLIRVVRPTGPYRLGGWCVSAWLAYEIAQQLRHAGEAVDLLLLVDAWAPGYWRRIGRIRGLFGKANYYFSRGWSHCRATVCGGIHADHDEDGGAGAAAHLRTRLVRPRRALRRRSATSGPG